MNNVEIEEEINNRLRTADLLFSIFSMVLCIFLFILIVTNKKLRSLTYDYLLCVFISEIFNSIGNIIQYAKIKLIGTFLIAFSDIFTMSIFISFIYSSCEQLIKSNKNIKTKKKLLIPICIGASVLYALIFVIIFRNKDEDAVNFYFYEDNSHLKVLRYFHIVILFLASVYISYKTFLLLKFLKEKQVSDNANAWKIAVLIKTLFRFPVICILYWFSYFLYLCVSNVEDYKIKYIFKLFAKTFLGLRGFFIALTTIQTNKIQILIEKIIEVYIKHDLILKLSCCGNKPKRRKSRQKKKK